MLLSKFVVPLQHFLPLALAHFVIRIISCTYFGHFGDGVYLLLDMAKEKRQKKRAVDSALIF